MNILGVGPTEFVLILLIALIVAGPKRMIQWMYHLGRWTAKARAAWSEIMEAMQRELNESGVDIELPRDIPTRQNINQSVRSAFKPLSQPVEEAMGEVKQVQDTLKGAARDVKQQTKGLQTDVKRAAEQMQSGPPAPAAPAAKSTPEARPGDAWASAALGETPVHTANGTENGAHEASSDDANDQQRPAGFGTWAQYGGKDE